MRYLGYLPFFIYHLPLNLHFSFTKRTAFGLKRQMLNDKSLRIRLIKENYLPRPSLQSLKEIANLVRGCLIDNCKLIIVPSYGGIA